MNEIKVRTAIEQIARKEGVTVGEVRIEIEKAMLIGLCDPD